MKIKLLFILFCFITLNVMGQGVVTRKTNSSAKKTTTQVRTHKTSENKKVNTTPIKEAAGYDVTFSSNVPDIKIIVDGNLNASNGTLFLKTGFHTVELTAEGYQTYTNSIQVDSRHQEFTFTMEKKPFDDKVLTFTVNGISFDMIPVVGGTFTMGATSEQGNEGLDSEKPTHQVTLSSYHIGKFEVTQELWKAVMGSNPSSFIGDKLPVESVTWRDCQEFVTKLNNLTGQTFRLPTEAEWEFAARGGNKSKGYKYSGSNFINDIAWYSVNSNDRVHAVGTKLVNELGIGDMSGNVYEWCIDWYEDYSSASQINPSGPQTGTYRVARGGGWGGDAKSCRLSNRFLDPPSDRYNFLGLRLVLSKIINHQEQ